MPMELHEGTSPIANVDPPISTSVTRNVYLRPTISPNLPKTRAPNGLTTKPMANVSRVDNRAIVLSPDGKNWSEITAARLPKMKKSYHSIRCAGARRGNDSSKDFFIH